MHDMPPTRPLSLRLLSLPTHISAESWVLAVVVSGPLPITQEPPTNTQPPLLVEVDAILVTCFVFLAFSGPSLVVFPRFIVS
jgi:hypothetical protein